jgi:N-acetylmuramoyl-L-alanine amidase
MDYHLESTALSMSLIPTSLYSPDERKGVDWQSINVYLLLSVGYWLGFTFMICRFIFFVTKIILIKNRSRLHQHGSTRIVEMGSGFPFSFFNMIFLPNLKINPIIIEHENIHVVLLHWIDLIVIEIACAILWFNPIMFFYRRSIKIQHEYQADACTISKGVKLEHYLNCMLLQIQSENEVAPISEFYSQTIKKRINMMTKNKTARKFSGLYLLTLPAIGMLLFAFSNQSASPLENNSSGISNDNQRTIIVDAGHGGQDDGVHAADGVNEKEIVLSIAKQIQQAGQEKGIQVILTRTGDEALDLKERVLFTNRFSADLFISLHVNYDQHDSDLSGMDCIISEGSTKFNESKQLAEKVMTHLKTLPGIAVNDIKKSNAYVLKSNSVPAVLVELGYLSNKQDYAFIRDEKNQKLLSEQIIAAVLSYSK